MLSRRLGIVAAVLLILGLAVDVALWQLYPWPGWLYLLNLAPGLLVALLSRWGSSRSRRLFTLTSVVVVAVLAIICVVNLAVVVLPLETTDAGAYTRTLRTMGHLRGRLGWGHVLHVSHFPRVVPEGASWVRFFCLPEAPLSISCVELRYRTSAADARRILATYLPRARQVDAGGDWDQWREKQKGMPSTIFRNESNTDFAPLPRHFRVLIFDAKWWGDPRSVAGGHSYGIAVSLKTREVIYWAADWFIS